MSEERIWSLVIPFLSGIVGAASGILVSLFTGRRNFEFALKQFYSQRWWEAKKEAYSDILRQLSQLRYSLIELLGHELDANPLTAKRRQELLRKCDEAIESFEGAAALGEFLVLADAEATLRDLLTFLRHRRPDASNSNSNDWFQYYDNAADKVQDCIGSIRGAARKDLTSKET